MTYNPKNHNHHSKSHDNHFKAHSYKPSKQFIPHRLRLSDIKKGLCMHPVRLNTLFSKLKSTPYLLLLLMTTLVMSPVHAIDLNDVFSNTQSPQQKFLSVEQAFKVSVNNSGQKISVNFTITPGHYVYQDKLKLSLPDGVTASKFSFNQSPSFVDDPSFGRVAVFDQNRVTATATLKNTNNANITNSPVKVKWQGCAKAGLCYPPESVSLKISLPSQTSSKTSIPADSNAAKPAAPKTTEPQTTETKATKTAKPETSNPKQPATSQKPAQVSGDANNSKTNTSTASTDVVNTVMSNGKNKDKNNSQDAAGLNSESANAQKPNDSNSTPSKTDTPTSKTEPEPKQTVKTQNTQQHTQQPSANTTANTSDAASVTNEATSNEAINEDSPATPEIEQNQASNGDNAAVDALTDITDTAIATDDSFENTDSIDAFDDEAINASANELDSQANLTDDASNNSVDGSNVDASDFDSVPAITMADGPDNSDIAIATAQTVGSNQVNQQANQLANQSGYALNHVVNMDSKELSGDPFGLSKNPVLALFLIFIAGLGLAFTPCVLPMLPIVANIVAQQKGAQQKQSSHESHDSTGDSEPSYAKRSFFLSLSYGVGVSTAYGLLGAIIAYVGESLGILGWLQNPIILLSFAAVFVVLGLYMLEVIHLRLPDVISQPLHKMSQSANHKLGSMGGTFLVGLLSALVVSPCVSAPLSGVLVAVATIGNVWLGFTALFMLGFGLSIPLVIFATTEGKLLPEAGEWMTWIKHGFAYLMFAVALLMIERIFVSPLMLVLWGVWFGVLAIWLFNWRGRGRLISKGLAVLAAAWVGCLLFGAVNGSTDSWQPLAKSDSQVANKRSVDAKNNSQNSNKQATTVQTPQAAITVYTLAELDEHLKYRPQVLVDVTAEWCIECRIMEKTLFAKPPEALANWQVIKLDITDTTAASKRILSRYQLFGPPALLYYKKGQLLTVQKGEVKREEFEHTLDVLAKQ